MFLLHLISFGMFISIFICLKVFLISLLLSSLTHWFYSRMLFNLHIFVNFPVFFLWVTSSFIYQCGWKRCLCDFNLLKFVKNHWHTICPRGCFVCAWEECLCCWYWIEISVKVCWVCQTCVQTQSRKILVTLGWPQGELKR